MARNSPERIWTPRQSPKSDPKFHRILILEGEGRATTLLLAAERSG